MANNRVARGVRKVNETITQEGRALILTEEQADKLNWNDIPVGSVRINTAPGKNSGIWSVKVEGESDWIPGGIKNDGTICIAKDSSVIVEKYIVKSLKDQLDPRKFDYVYIDNGVPKNRRGYILYQNEIGELGEYDCYGDFVSWSAYQKKNLLPANASSAKYKNIKLYGYVFTLEKGDYAVGRNHLDVKIDGVLDRNAATKSLYETNEKSFCMFESDLDIDMEITAQYIHAFRIGNPYPRIFVNPNEPENSAAENGDIWIDTDATLEEEDPLGDHIEDDNMIGWDRIRPSTRPTTLKGYGITDNVSYKGHVHSKNEIVDFPAAMPANGGHSDTANQATKANVANYADKADFATKAGTSGVATNDGAGRNIVNTYATKAELNVQKKRIDGNELVKNDTQSKRISFKAAKDKKGRDEVVPYIDNIQVRVPGGIDDVEANPAISKNQPIWTEKYITGECIPGSMSECGRVGGWWWGAPSERQERTVTEMSISPVFDKGTYTLEDLLKKLTSYAHTHSVKSVVHDNRVCNCNCHSDHSH